MHAGRVVLGAVPVLRGVVGVAPAVGPQRRQLLVRHDENALVAEGLYLVGARGVDLDEDELVALEGLAVAAVKDGYGGRLVLILT